ncbi:MAG TPA: hypothetical protein VN784_13125 [Candidatus Limnocylindrales bacterium]|nr:hypothetical protein [Candidatus Limnocylindrales bacterium]
MQRLDSAFATAYYKWITYIFLAFMWGTMIVESAKGNHRGDFMYYVLPPCTFLLLWFFSRFKQVTLAGDTLIIRGSGREARVLTSQIKQIYKRNGKMPYISIVFKSKTEFGRCVRILNNDVEKIAKILRAAMEGRDVGVKINHVERDPTHVPHQKEVIVSGWTSEELSGILTDFGDVYSGRLGPDFDYEVQPHDMGSTRITFPHDIPAEQFSFLVNYLQYPKNYDLKARSISVVGKARLSPEFHPPSENLVGQKAIFYIPTKDQSYDLVYVRVGDETFENSFASRRWKRVTDSRIPPGVEVN